MATEATQARVDDVDDPLVGAIAGGRFRIAGRIAGGGMGNIYHAEQVGLGREVALKVMHLVRHPDGSEDTAGSEEFGRRMLNEAAAAAALRHPNTIVIHDYGHLDDGRCFIAMELLEGRTLQEAIAEKGRLEPERVIHVGLQIAGSLAEAHEAGMIHRDLKPGNVMLTPRGQDGDFAKVLDFGLVKKDPKDEETEASGALVGTPRYMAPEQVIADQVSEATDVYGLGATLYHALTGRPPFESDSRFVLMAAHVTAQPKAISEVLEGTGVEVPAALEAVVMRCLQKEPAARYQHMHELAEALMAASSAPPSTLRASLPSSPRGKGRERVFAGISELDSLAVTIDEPPRSSPRLWVALGALAVLVAAAAVMVAAHKASVDSSPELVPEPRVVARAEVPEVPEISPAAVIPEPAGLPPEAELRTLVVSTSPAHASLRRGDADLGNGPLTLEVPEGEEWTLEISAPGYVSRTITVNGQEREVNVRLTPRRSRTPAIETEESTSTSPRSDNRDPWAEEGSSGSR